MGNKVKDISYKFPYISNKSKSMLILMSLRIPILLLSFQFMLEPRIQEHRLVELSHDIACKRPTNNTRYDQDQNHGSLGMLGDYDC